MSVSKIKLRHAAVAAILAACAARPARSTVSLQQCIRDVERVSREVNTTRGQFREALTAHLRDVSEILQHLNLTPRDTANVALAIDARGRIQVIRDLWRTSQEPGSEYFQQLFRLQRMYETLHSYVEGAPREFRPLPPPPQRQSPTARRKIEEKRFERRRV